MKLNIVRQDRVENFASFQNRLKRMAHRASHLCGHTLDGKPLGAHIHELLMESWKGNTDPGLLAERAEWLAKAESSPELQQQLCAINVQTISNYALADSNWASLWFEMRNLKKDERPVYQNETPVETRITATANDAGAKNLFKVVPSQTEQLIDLMWLSTPEVRMKKVDIYRGDILDSQSRLLRQAFDWNQDIDERAFTLATTAPANSGQGGGLFGPFNVGTASRRELEVFITSRRVKLKNLPSRNDITLAGKNFNYAVFKAALDYEVRWGKALEGGSPQLTGRVFLPGVDITGIAGEVTPTGNTNNSVADQMLEKGWSVIGYLGRNFVLVPDNTIESGTCYFEFTEKPGVMFFKPELAVEETRDDYATRKNNEQFRYAKQPFGAYVNHTRRVHALEITYNGKKDILA